MEPLVAFSSLQEPATGIFPEQDESNSHPLILDIKISFNIICLSLPTNVKWFLLFAFPQQIFT